MPLRPGCPRFQVYTFIQDMSGKENAVHSPADGGTMLAHAAHPSKKPDAWFSNPVYVLTTPTEDGND